MTLTSVGILLTLFFGFTSGEYSLENDSVFIQSFKGLLKKPPIGHTMFISPSIKTEWIDQNLDNFDNNETRTWKMRYMINDEYFQNGGPMFIMVGGEWTIDKESISNGHFVDLAKKYNAILFYTEHRFYGESVPFSEMTSDSFRYLNVFQALADLAKFIEYQRETNPALRNSKVIMSGCSYSASMVTWFRRLYPALIDGGWASSGPLIAKVDFKEYKEIVGRSFKTLGDDKCYNRLHNGFNGLEKMWSDKRFAEIRSMFKLCNNFDENNDLDMWTFFDSITSPFSSIAQYQTGNQVQRECAKLLSLDKDDVIAVSKYILSAWQNIIKKSKCVDVTYQTSVTELRNTSIIESARPWFFQTCNEYGWYQSSSSTNQPFGTKFPATLYISLCEDIFGSNYKNSNIAQNVLNTNENFGGLDPGVTKIYTVHGGLDPWSTIGLPIDKGASYISDASHCPAERSLRESDSTEMKIVKYRIDELISQWLKIK